jgi:hypothetical protein
LSARRLRVELAPSVSLAIALLALHAVAALCVLAVMPGMPGLLIGGLLLALGAATVWSRALLCASSSVRALELGAPKLTVELANGAIVDADVAERRYVGRFFVILPVRLNASRPVRRAILVTRDMTGADSFRRLRIWALWGKLPLAASRAAV